MKAAAQMADMIGRADRAKALAQSATSALEALEKQLWNGEYYGLSFDLKAGKGNAGCMADQLCGDWFVRQSDGIGIVQEDRARKSLEAVFRYCMRGKEYLVNCEWPKGGRVKIRRETSDQARCPWSGVEFAVAAEMILLGLRREGMTVLRGIYDRYDRFGMRYNHVECGTHYYRAMSSWAPYLAITGFAWDAFTRRMRFALPKGKGRFLWSTPSAWGTVSMRPSKKVLCEIRVLRGEIDIQGLLLSGVAAKCVSVKAGGKRIDAASEALGRETTIVLPKPTTLREGYVLSVSL
jgi:hypothetical protein